MFICNLKNDSLLNIRRAEPKDAAQLVNIASRIGGESEYLTFGHDDFYFTEEQQRNFIININEKENCLYIVGIIDNKIVGTLSFIAPGRKRTMHRGELGIGVLKEYWGLEVASRLMEYFLKWTSSNGIVRKVDLEVREDNIRAINLYLKFGFKIEGKISKGMYVNGVFYDIYCMGLQTIG